MESFWATNENITQDPRNPKRLKKALREYDRSSSSVRNDANIRLMLATIIVVEDGNVRFANCVEDWGKSWTDKLD